MLILYRRIWTEPTWVVHIADWITANFGAQIISPIHIDVSNLHATMSRRNTLSAIWLSWLVTLVISTQEPPPAVTMLFPPKVRDKHPKIYFDAGETVIFNWTSTFPCLSLELYQGPRPDGHWVMVPLLSMWHPCARNVFSHHYRAADH